MSSYRVAPGVDIAEVDLIALSPQPRSEGVKAVRRSYAASGAVYDEGKYLELEFDVLEDATAYVALLTLFGLASVLYAPVTVYARDSKFQWTRYNGIAVRPEIGADGASKNFFLRDFTFLVKDLVVAA